MLDWEFLLLCARLVSVFPTSVADAEGALGVGLNEEQEYKVKLGVYIKIMEEEEEASGQNHSFSSLM